MNEIVIKPKTPFNGFINYFHKRTDVFSFFKAESEAYNNNWGDASKVINYSITGNHPLSQWVSPPDPSKSYIVFNFKCPIYLTHYTLRTRTDISENFPVSWIVECSYDGKNWFLVDTKVDRKELLDVYANWTYKCDRAFMYAKKIRIWCKKTTSSDLNHFHLSRVEFFGKMDIEECKPPFSSNIKYSCKHRNIPIISNKNHFNLIA